MISTHSLWYGELLSRSPQIQVNSGTVIFPHFGLLDLHAYFRQILRYFLSLVHLPLAIQDWLEGLPLVHSPAV